MNRSPVKNKDLTTLRLILGAVLISFSGIWVKTAQVSPTSAAFYRVFFGGIILLIVAFCKGELKQRKPSNLWLVLLCGFLFALDLFFYHTSIRYVGPGLATILSNFEVIILAAVGILCFKEKASVNLPAFGSPGVSWALSNRRPSLGSNGCGLSNGHLLRIGNGGLLWGIHFVPAQTPVRSSGIVDVLRIDAGISGVVGLSRNGNSRGRRYLPDTRSRTFLSLAALGLFSQSAGWILIANALPRMRASLSGLILLLQPALAFIWDVFFFQRPTRWINWIGVAIVLAAIYLGTVKPSNSQKGKTG